MNQYAENRQLLAEHLAIQGAEVQSPFNRLCTAQALGISPDLVSGNQLYVHYMGTGRHIVLRNVHEPTNVYGTGEEFGVDPIVLPWDVRELKLWEHFCKWHPAVPPFDMGLFPVAQQLLWVMSAPF